MDEKKNVLLNLDDLRAIKRLDMQQRGTLLTAIIAYQTAQELPEMDVPTGVAWDFIQGSIDWNNRKYEERCEKNRSNIRKRWKNQEGPEMQESGPEHTDTTVYDRIPSNTNEYERIPTDTNAYQDVPVVSSGIPSYTNAYLYDNDIDNDSDSDTDKDIKNTADSGQPQTPQKAARTRNQYSSQFEEFWAVYPRKDEKAACYKKYQARIKDGWTHEELVAAALNYSKAIEASHTEKRFIKMGRTFLSDSTPFTDYLPRTTQNASQGPQEAPEPTDEGIWQENPFTALRARTTP